MTWRWALGVMLLIHGGIVAAQATGVPTSWLLGNLHSLGVWLTVIAGALLVAGGVSLLAVIAAWRPLTVVGPGLSLVFFVIFFQPIILLGFGIDIALVAAVGYFAWPTPSMTGA
jgi:hypothetical protein